MLQGVYFGEASLEHHESLLPPSASKQSRDEEYRTREEEIENWEIAQHEHHLEMFCKAFDATPEAACMAKLHESLLPPSSSKQSRDEEYRMRKKEIENWEIAQGELHSKMLRNAFDATPEAAYIAKLHARGAARAAVSSHPRVRRRLGQIYKATIVFPTTFISFCQWFGTWNEFPRSVRRECVASKERLLMEYYPASGNPTYRPSGSVVKDEEAWRKCVEKMEEAAERQGRDYAASLLKGYTWGGKLKCRLHNITSRTLKGLHEAALSGIGF